MKSISLWAALPAHTGDERFRLNGAAIVREVEAGVQNFDTILVCFGATHFYFEAIDTRRSPVIASYLRESLASGVAPENLHKKDFRAKSVRLMHSRFMARRPKTNPVSRSCCGTRRNRSVD